MTLFNVGFTFAHQNCDENKEKEQERHAGDHDSCNLQDSDQSNDKSDHDYNDFDDIRMIVDCEVDNSHHSKEPTPEGEGGIELNKVHGTGTLISHTITNWDIGNLPNILTSSVIEECVSLKTSCFPLDFQKINFPKSLLKRKKPNGDYSNHDWLVWSRSKHVLFCFPCHLMKLEVSLLSCSEGWSGDQGWKKMYCRIPEHERSISYRKAYLEWRSLEVRIINNSSVHCRINNGIVSEVQKWKEVLERIIDIELFLGKRHLSFRGFSQRIGDPHNGNFLGIVELLSRYDSVLQAHVSKVNDA